MFERALFPTRRAQLCGATVGNVRPTARRTDAPGTRHQRDRSGDDLVDRGGGLRSDRPLGADLLAQSATRAQAQFVVDAAGTALVHAHQCAGRTTLRACHAGGAGRADAALAPRQVSPRQSGGVFAQHSLVTRRAAVLKINGWRRRRMLRRTGMRALPGCATRGRPQPGAAQETAARSRHPVFLPTLRLHFVAAVRNDPNLRCILREPRLQGGLDRRHRRHRAALRTWAALAESMELEASRARCGSSRQHSGIEDLVAGDDKGVVSARGAVGAGAAMDVDRGPPTQRPHERRRRERRQRDGAGRALRSAGATRGAPARIELDAIERQRERLGGAGVFTGRANRGAAPNVDARCVVDQQAREIRRSMAGHAVDGWAATGWARGLGLARLPFHRRSLVRR